MTVKMRSSIGYDIQLCYDVANIIRLDRLDLCQQNVDINDIIIIVNKIMIMTVIVGYTVYRKIKRLQKHTAMSIF